MPGTRACAAQRPHLHCACARFDTKKCGEETGHRSHGTCCGCRGRADPGTQHLEITAPGAQAPLPSLLTVARRMATERVRLKESKAPCFSILPDLPAPRSRRFYRRCGPARMPALCPALGGTVLGLQQTLSEHQPLRTRHPPPGLVSLPRGSSPAAWSGHPADTSKSLANSFFSFALVTLRPS